MNLRNYGVAIGRLTKDPVSFTNSDGSRKVMLTIAAQDNFRSGPDKKKDSQFIEVEAFLSKDTKGDGVYGYMHKGDLIGVEYTVKSSSYEKDGKTVYAQSLMVQSVDLMEGKRTTDARQAKNAAAATDAAAPAPAAEQDDAPFGAEG